MNLYEINAEIELIYSQVDEDGNVDRRSYGISSIIAIDGVNA